jgi:polygalacturonase
VTGPVSRRRFLAVGAGGVVAVAWPRRPSRPTLDVRAYGATGDGTHLDTAAVQRALDAAGRRAATLRVGPGTFRCGTLRLRSGVQLVLEAGATLLASSRPEDFLPVERLPYPTYSDAETSGFHEALLLGDGIHDVVITGPGTIDGGRTERNGPKPIALHRCRRATVSGVTIRNAPNYCVSLGGCDDVVVDSVTIRDAFADGIDPDCCRRVRIVGCDIESDDDAIVLKTSLILGAPRPTEDVVVERCRMMSPSNGFKIGTETSGAVRRVTVRDCQVSGRARPTAIPAVVAGEAGGVAIESVDGAAVEDVVVERVTVTDAAVPLFVRLGARGRGQRTPTPGAIRGVAVRDLSATGATSACTVSGVPGHPVESLVLERAQLHTADAGGRRSTPVPELPAAYPQAGMFGPLPASGLWIRHARRVQLRDVTVAATGDPRPPLVTDDVTGLDVAPPL